ncbi:hypothetical protein [Sphingomonas sp. 35-24ZXX]|uniref:hypothetical protein n=1 Tax=Sphingomonas sp. 35-24ZXX TaxID=1545915 RepID=UPI0018CDCEB9|nr:hypothetical protein [Sphingomonas sp. 35-24ZXX]
MASCKAFPLDGGGSGGGDLTGLRETALAYDSTQTHHHPYRCDYGSKLPSLAASPI